MTIPSWLKMSKENNEKQLTIKMTPTLYNWIERESIEYGKTKSEICRILMECAIRNIEK